MLNKTWANGDPIAVADYQRWEDSGGLGWYLISAAAGYWTFASSTTINVPSGAANFFQKGDKLRLKQGGSFKYFVIVAVTDTLLTVCAGADFSVANANITDVYISRGESPIGWPGKFSLSNPTWTTTGTAFTNQPANGNNYMRFVGNICELWGDIITNAASGGTGAFVGTFTSGQFPAIVTSDPNGHCMNITDYYSGGCYFSAIGVIRMAKSDGTAIAANSKGVKYRAAYEY